MAPEETPPPPLEQSDPELAQQLALFCSDITVRRERKEARLAQAREMRRQTGRNDPCPCGSGRKFKRCCLDKV